MAADPGRVAIINLVRSWQCMQGSHTWIRNFNWIEMHLVVSMYTGLYRNPFGELKNVRVFLECPVSCMVCSGGVKMMVRFLSPFTPCVG